MLDWNEYMRRVIAIVERTICRSSDANMILSVKAHMSREVNFYRSRWVDHQKYGLRTPEEFAALYGYR